LKDLRLYGYWRSSCSWRVRIALHLKEIPFDYVAVNLLEGAQKAEPHAARNGMRQVPTLEWRDDAGVRHLSQSLAILRFLERVKPGLEPADPLAAGYAWELAEMVNAGIQPLQNLGVLKAIEGMGGDRKGWGQKAIATGFAAMERRARDIAGAYLVGDEVSVADVCLVPQLYNGRRFEVPMDDYPTLLRVEENLTKLPAFAAAHPDQQPDAVKS